METNSCKGKIQQQMHQQLQMEQHRPQQAKQQAMLEAQRRAPQDALCASEPRLPTHKTEPMR